MDVCVARLTSERGRFAASAMLALVLGGVTAQAHAGEIFVCKVLSDCAGEAGCDSNARQYVLDPERNTVEFDGLAYRLDYLGQEDDMTVASASPDRGDIEVKIDSDGDAIIADDGTYEGKCRKAMR